MNSTTPTESPKHSPLPWTLRTDKRAKHSMDIMSEKNAVAKVNSYQTGAEANAAFIINACNAYESLLADREELVGALKESEFLLQIAYETCTTGGTVHARYRPIGKRNQAILARMEAKNTQPE